MKKCLFYTAVAIVCAGCTAEPIQEDIIVDNNGGVVTLNASIEGFENDTRTTYTDNISLTKALVSWSAGDAISVLYSNGSGGSYSQETFTTGNGDGVFSGAATRTEGGKYAYFAIYPSGLCNSIWPDNTNLREQFQVTLPDNVTGSGADAIPMVAHTLSSSWDGVYHFKHLSSVLRFSITNIPSNATYLVISHESKELAGLFYISYVDGLPTLHEGDTGGGNERTMTYAFTPIDGTYSFYLPFIVGGTPSGNFTFTFKNASGEVLCSRTTTLGPLASVTLARNTMYRVSIDALSFDGYPGLSTLEITPEDVPTTPGAFTVDGVGFYADRAFKQSSSDIKLEQSGDIHGKIYNTTALGRITKIVVEQSGNYSFDKDWFVAYAGTEEAPSTSVISPSSYSSTGATYIFSDGSYSYFSYVNNVDWGGVRVGGITVYYLPSD